MTLQEFSVLSPIIPWEAHDIWRTIGAYFFILHIPFSFGGLGVVAELLHCSSLDPLTTVSTTVVLQLTELSLALALLQYTTKKDHKIWPYFAGKLYPQQSWVKETVMGFILLMTMVSLTTIVGDTLIGLEDTYDPMLRKILFDSPTSRLLCIFLYCVMAPLSEETIYRGFLLTALSSSMKWKDAVIVSSIMFSIAHFSVNSSLQLFFIGCITGLAYCRTGTLSAPLTIHSLYNAAILYMTLMS
uniref:CAAX prenyl protease 2/Lysostaphin resistance protein A-like domain-containing protein n=1 Tax=Leersia perrieri TaxID=77586 RepID=A0A0D9WYI6_9ORYZ